MAPAMSVEQVRYERMKADPSISIHDLEQALEDFWKHHPRDMSGFLKEIRESGATWKSAAKAHRIRTCFHLGENKLTEVFSISELVSESLVHPLCDFANFVARMQEHVTRSVVVKCKVTINKYTVLNF